MGTWTRSLHHAIEHRPLVRKSLLGCGIVSSLLYIATDILASRRYPGYRYLDQEFSELTAQSAPTRNFMIALNAFPYGLLVTAFAGGIWATPCQTRSGRLTAAMLVGYTTFGIAGGLIFPMETRGNRQTLRNAMHIPSTALMALCMLLGMGFGSRLLGSRFQYYSYGTIATLLAFGGLASLQASRLAANEPTPLMGLEERVNIYATMLWLAVLATALLRIEEGPNTRGALAVADPGAKRRCHAH